MKPLVPAAARILRSFAVVGALAVAITAQVSQWASVPAGTTTAIEQSIVVTESGNTVRAFSALTKRWATLNTVFAPPQRTLLNDHLIVRDGPVFHAFSARGSAWASLFVSNAAALVPAGSPQTFASAVTDGNRLHVFFADTGRWQSYVFATPPLVTMGRFCMLVTDATATWAISDYFGTLVQAPPGATALRADGNVALAQSPGALHGFAAGTNRWATLPVVTTPTIAIGNPQPTVLAVSDGATISMFSGHSGAFTTLPAAPSATVMLQRELAIVVDGTVVHGYSGLTGTAAILTAAAPPTVTMEQMFALVDDGTALTAFSATTGTFSAPLSLPGAIVQTRAQVALLSLGSYAWMAYGALHNQWVPVPLYPTATPYVNAVAVVLVEPNGGVHGWSQHGSAFVDLATPPIDTVVVGTNPPNVPETIFLRSGNTIYTFNPRTEKWRSCATAAPATLVRAHYQAILAQDGQNAYAFDIWSDRWSQQSLPGGFVTGTAQVQAAYVNDGARVHAFGGFGQLALLGEFPDFYRAVSEGMPLRLDTVGEPMADTILAVSFAPAELALPFGTLLLDPASMIFLSSSTLAADGRATFTIMVPPGYRGIEVHFQAAVLQGADLYLTNGVSPLLL